MLTLPAGGGFDNCKATEQQRRSHRLTPAVGVEHNAYHLNREIRPEPRGGGYRAPETVVARDHGRRLAGNNRWTGANRGCYQSPDI